MAKGKAGFTEEQSACLAALYGRALDARKNEPILGDPTAEGAMRRIDYDFGKLGVSHVTALMVAARARRFDDMVREFLRAHSTATVLHLGCGLDSRVYRLAPPDSVHWIDVDHPDIVALRSEVYPDQPPHYTVIGSPVTDPAWVSRIPADAPTLVVAEGLIPYLHPDEGRALLRALVEHLPSGEMIFDAMGSLAVRMQKLNPAVRRTKATLRWAIDDPRELEPLGLTTIRSLGPDEMVPPQQRAKAPLPYRLQFAMLGMPLFRDLAHLMHARFGQAT
ncbi:class I SAM-dependent methyltransferase [Nocardia sp. CDC159]|uniref:Class I SAM-dependent methyltransferase n=1 Tax=Nocardia pulmonis TaxID=2951408 RepID=A0A9X2J3A1_9NOCA|nr:MULTISPECIES: class I SAM-dependent methyltransferase [Nocardia]MCM6778886.1 class I SAM-dependent methyltransferase [Nocardia pulmonis]MCM6791775.1 class I SAM-dependent methyltransferase [Nocardia sp. CDC159]